MARPKEFDRDAVLERAMHLFWERGYEATSIGDLTTHLGIGRQSLYDTFGDKHGLYLAALDRYIAASIGQVPGALRDHRPLRRQIRDLLQGLIEATTASEGRSCMLVLAAAERCNADTEVKRRFCANGARMEEALFVRLTQARTDGELAAHHDPRALARYFVTTIYGLQMSARGGTAPDALEQAADVAVMILG